MNKKTTRRTIAALLILGLVSQWGCSTTKLPEYSSASGFAHHAVVPGHRRPADQACHHRSKKLYRKGIEGQNPLARSDLGGICLLPDGQEEFAVQRHT